MWCSAADTYLKLLDRVVNTPCFLTGGGLDCDLAHRRSVAVLCMLYKIRPNTMHQLCGTLPVPYVAPRVTRGFCSHIDILMRLLGVEPHSTAGLYSTLSISLE